MALVHDSFSDFVLFPKDNSHFEMLELRQEEGFENAHYIPTAAMHHHFSELANPTYDAYPSTSPFSDDLSGIQNQYAALNFIFDTPKENERVTQQRFTPSGSPSPSVTQSFDHPPSILSSTSGASAQSTPSSAVGSPYSHETNHVPAQELWMESHQGLGIAPGIAHCEGYGNDMYSLTNIENDLTFNGDKFSNSFVGKSQMVFSTSSASSASMPASASSCISSQTFKPALTALPLTLDTSLVLKDGILNSIREEANGKIDTLITATISPFPTSLIETSPRQFRNTRFVHPSSRAQSSFKSPKTPASASSMSPFASRKPPQAWVHDYNPQENFMGASSDSMAPENPTPSAHHTHPHEGSITPACTQAHPFRTFHHAQSHFFSQSSSSFIAPLESSCWFSLAAYSFIFFLSSGFSFRLL